MIEPKVRVQIGDRADELNALSDQVFSELAELGAIMPEYAMIVVLERANPDGTVTVSVCSTEAEVHESRDVLARTVLGLQAAMREQAERFMDPALGVSWEDGEDGA